MHCGRVGCVLPNHLLAWGAFMLMNRSRWCGWHAVHMFLMPHTYQHRTLHPATHLKRNEQEHGCCGVGAAIKDIVVKHCKLSGHKAHGRTQRQLQVLRVWYTHVRVHPQHVRNTVGLLSTDT